MKDRRTPKDKRGRGGRTGDRRQVGNGRRVWLPSRVDVVDRLDRDGLLPAIVFVFSRVGCEAAVKQCVQANLRLTTPAERDEVHERVETACRHLPDDDLNVLGYHDFLDALTRGIGAHHAGMLPAFKEVVEDLFTRGLVKVVFATETLALGINMPARTVVIEKLDKWNGETHAAITPGEYTQLTGRAGRRGLDVEGHGVVLWQQGMNPRELAGLASTRTYPLRSSFAPSYNMAVNLVHQFGRERARELLELSFAQFQADKAVVGLARQLRKAEEALDGYAEAATCDRGDFMEYARMRQEINDAEKGAARARRSDRREEAVKSLEKLRPGDVIEVPSGKFAGYAVVVDPGYSGEGPRPLVVTAERQARRLSVVDFPTPVVALTRLKVPRNFSSRNPQMRRDLASALRSRTHDLAPAPPSRRPATQGAGIARHGDEVDRLRTALREHPCHGCPDREDHARWAERWFKLDQETRTLRRRVEERTNTVARQFDRVCEVLTSLEYLDGDTVTRRGQRLMRLYSDLDLVTAEALRTGVLDGLDTAGFAAALSVLVFAARRPDDDAPRVPGGATHQAIEELGRLAGRVHTLERQHRLDFTRQPELGFAWVTYRWAEGDDLDAVLRGAGGLGLSAGDFVRWMKQVIDMAGQVADAAGAGPVRDTARDAVRALRRGVVAYSAVAD